MTSYWERQRTKGLSRRRFVGGAGATGLGVSGMALVGCGDDDDAATPTTQATQSTGATAAPAAPTRGGTARYPIFGTGSAAGIPSLYPFENLGYPVQTFSLYHYSRPLRVATGPDTGLTDFGVVEGDLFQGLPEQPDSTTYVLKFKPNVFFHDKAPMNGRQATLDDLISTWSYFSEQAINRTRFVDVIDKFEKTADDTLTITLKRPDAPFITNKLASDAGLMLVPTETINNDQVKTDPVGTGPWVFEAHEPGVRVSWKRHDKYFEEGQPYLDGIEASFLGDPQRILAGLQSGDIDQSTLTAGQVKQAQDSLNEDGQFNFGHTGQVIGAMFDFDNGPWRDKRVRQAMSMAFDRQGWLDVIDQTGEGQWMSYIGPALTPFYMSPRDDTSEWGDSSKFFQHNITEAKALLSAAGHPDGFDLTLVSNVDRYGPVAQQHWELAAAGLRDIGINAQNAFQEYGAYIQSTFFGKVGQPNAIGFGYIIGTVLDPDDIFSTCYWSGSSRRNWQGTPVEEQAGLDTMFVKQQGILETDERVEYIKDIQRAMGVAMITTPTVGLPTFTYIQPWMQNTHWIQSYAYGTDTLRKSYFTDERIRKG